MYTWPKVSPPSNDYMYLESRIDLYVEQLYHSFSLMVLNDYYVVNYISNNDSIVCVFSFSVLYNQPFHTKNVI